MDIKIGDKVRFNQKGLDTPGSGLEWRCIGLKFVSRAKASGTGTVTRINRRSDGTGWSLGIDFRDPDMPDFDWPVEMFEKVPEEEKLGFTRKEKELLRELVQEKLKGYQELLDKLQ